jgi:hypothetical protein
VRQTLGMGEVVRVPVVVVVVVVMAVFVALAVAAAFFPFVVQVPVVVARVPVAVVRVAVVLMVLLARFLHSAGNGDDVALVDGLGAGTAPLGVDNHRRAATLAAWARRRERGAVRRLRLRRRSLPRCCRVGSALGRVSAAGAPEGGQGSGGLVVAPLASGRRHLLVLLRGNGRSPRRRRCGRVFAAVLRDDVAGHRILVVVGVVRRRRLLLPVRSGRSRLHGVAWRGSRRHRKAVFVLRHRHRPGQARSVNRLLAVRHSGRQGSPPMLLVLGIGVTVDDGPLVVAGTSHLRSGVKFDRSRRAALEDRFEPAQRRLDDLGRRLALRSRRRPRRGRRVGGTGPV